MICADQPAVRAQVNIGVNSWRVLGAVHAVAEGHQPLSGVQHLLDVALGAGRRHHPGGERRGVRPVFGSAVPVGVDRLDVTGAGLAPPADQEPLGDRRRRDRSKTAFKGIFRRS
jgi:hypothetical protein